MTDDGLTPFETEPLLGYSVFARLLCWLFGHRWESVEAYYHCARCGIYDRWPA